MMDITAFIEELQRLGETFGFDAIVQISGCYGAPTQNFYFEEARIDTESILYSVPVVNIPSDLCSG